MYVQPAVTSVYSGGQDGGASSLTGPAKELGKDDFLRLFVYQLQNQDPLNPMESAEFTAELARFSSLEQLYNLNDNMEGMLAYQNSLNNGMSSNIIGKNIKWGESGEGLVTGVAYDDGAAYLVVDSGERVPLAEVKEIYSSR
jgi:flagellar basal-body rod modification protein FlgD